MASWAFIDIGSNSVVCVAVEVGENSAKIVYDKSLISALGRGLSTAGFHPESKARTTDAIASHLSALKAMGLAPTLKAVATSAMRDASDGPQYAAELRAQFGLDLAIASGEEEARLTYLAAAQSFPQFEAALTIDIGGGSTEFVSGKKGSVTARQSLNLGAVRFTDKYLKSDPPSAEAYAHLDAGILKGLSTLTVVDNGSVLIGSGSTISTVLTLRDAIEPYDAKRVHGQKISRSDVAQVLTRLKPLTLAERANLPGLAPKRAPVITAGIAILAAALDHFDLDEMVVSDRGLRFGLLYDTLGPITLVD